MKQLMKALYVRFKSTTGSPAIHNSLYTALNGKLYNSLIPQDASMPFGIFEVIANVYDWTFSESLERVKVQFSVYLDANNAATSAQDMMEHIKSLYDDCSLTVDGFQTYYMRRGNSFMTFEDNVWHVMVDYDLLLEKV